jgi:hypothetical protein
VREVLELERNSVTSMTGIEGIVLKKELDLYTPADSTHVTSCHKMIVSIADSCSTNHILKIFIDSFPDENDSTQCNHLRGLIPTARISVTPVIPKLSKHVYCTTTPQTSITVHQLDACHSCQRYTVMACFY